MCYYGSNNNKVLSNIIQYQRMNFCIFCILIIIIFLIYLSYLISFVLARLPFVFFFGKKISLPQFMFYCFCTGILEENIALFLIQNPNFFKFIKLINKCRRCTSYILSSNSRWFNDINSLAQSKINIFFQKFFLSPRVWRFEF